MIWSVSTSARSSTAARAVTRRNGFMLLADGLRVDEVAGESGGGGEGRADEVRAPALPLAALEVAVRRRRAALARLKDVRVHAQAHRAAGAAPLEAGGREDPVEALVLRLLLDAGRAGDDERAHGRVDVLAGHHRSGGA